MILGDILNGVGVVRFIISLDPALVLCVLVLPLVNLWPSRWSGPCKVFPVNDQTSPYAEG